MRFVIQVVTNADVKVEGKMCGQIGKGFLVLVGVGQGDNEQIAERMVRKMLGLRVFADENGKTNLSLAQVGGSLLMISQFTLYADCRKGNRPSFIKAGAPEEADRLYEYICELCAVQVPVVEKGVFGAYMMVSLTNDGPFTVILDSDELGYS